MDATPPSTDLFEQRTLYAEVALMRVPKGYIAHPDPDAPIGTIVLDPQVSLLGAPHILATDGHLATIETRKASSTAADVDKMLMSVLPRFDHDGSLRLEVAITVGKVNMKTTVVARDQQTSFLGGSGGDNPIVFLITPYVLRGKADLKRLLECKMSPAASTL